MSWVWPARHAIVDAGKWSWANQVAAFLAFPGCILPMYVREGYRRAIRLAAVPPVGQLQCNPFKCGGVNEVAATSFLPPNYKDILEICQPYITLFNS